MEKFVVFADKNGLKRRNLMIQKSHKLLERFVNSRILYNIPNDQAWTEYLHRETLRLFRDGEAYPRVEKKQEGPSGKVAMVFDSRSRMMPKNYIAHA